MALDQPKFVDPNELLNSHKLSGHPDYMPTLWGRKLLGASKTIAYEADLSDKNEVLRLASLISIWTRFEVAKRIWSGEVTSKEEIPSIEMAIQDARPRIDKVIDKTDALSKVVDLPDHPSIEPKILDGSFVIYPEDIRAIDTYSAKYLQLLKDTNVYKSNHNYAAEQSIQFAFALDIFREAGLSEKFLELLRRHMHAQIVESYAGFDPEVKRTCIEEFNITESEIEEASEAQLFASVCIWISSYLEEARRFLGSFTNQARSNSVIGYHYNGKTTSEPTAHSSGPMGGSQIHSFAEMTSLAYNIRNKRLRK